MTSNDHEASLGDVFAAYLPFSPAEKLEYERLQAEVNDLRRKRLELLADYKRRVESFLRQTNAMFECFYKMTGSGVFPWWAFCYFNHYGYPGPEWVLRYLHEAGAKIIGLSITAVGDTTNGRKLLDALGLLGPGTGRGGPLYKAHKAIKKVLTTAIVESCVECDGVTLERAYELTAERLSKNNVNITQECIKKWRLEVKNIPRSSGWPAGPPLLPRGCL